jgi:hypothetical protein
VVDKPGRGVAHPGWRMSASADRPVLA